MALILFFIKVHIEFTEGQDKITVEGPPEEVKKAVQNLNTFVKDLVSNIDYLNLPRVGHGESVLMLCSNNNNNNKFSHIKSKEIHIVAHMCIVKARGNPEVLIVATSGCKFPAQ